MSSMKNLALVSFALCLSAHSAVASNYVVGDCKPSLPSFSTISAAVGGATAGSTIYVCPGTYAEQVTISQPLTLKGMSSANGGQAVISVPGTPLTVVSSDFQDELLLAPMVYVTAGPVNIEDVTVDGTGWPVIADTNLVGILYATGSSGLVSETAIRSFPFPGVGVWAENSGSANQTVTVEKSSFHSVDSGIITYGSALTISATGNILAAVSTYGIATHSSTGTLAGNVINGLGGGLALVLDGPITATNNIISNDKYGIQASNGVTVLSNKISASIFGIADEGGANTYKSNFIFESGTAMELACNSAAVVLNNVINEAGSGMVAVPSTFSSPNVFVNVDTIRLGCD